MLNVRKVGVLMGGTSSEREVSLKSGRAVSDALKSLGYDVVDIDAKGGDLCRRIGESGIEAAFLTLHGGMGEDGSIQGMLEVIGMPYTWSGVLASAVAMDKLVSKAIFKANGLNVARYIAVSSPDVEIGLPMPVVVKPSREGSSIGVGIVKERSGLKAAIKTALSFDGPAIVEEFIRGKEIQIGVLADRALGGVEVRPKSEFYDYESKYTPGRTEYILPPEIDGDLYKKLMDAGARAHRALGCSGASRVDFIVDNEGTPYVLEVNTIPGMTATSLLPKIARLAGLGFEQLVEEILKEAIERRRQGSR